MHNNATDATDSTGASGSLPADHIAQTLMNNYERLDNLERLLADIIANTTAASGSQAPLLTGLLDQLRAAGLVANTDHLSDHCDACKGLQAIKYIRANVLALMRELAAQAIACSIPGAVEEVDLASIVKSSTAAIDAFKATPAAPH